MLFKSICWDIEGSKARDVVHKSNKLKIHKKGSSYYAKVEGITENKYYLYTIVQQGVEPDVSSYRNT